MACFGKGLKGGQHDVWFRLEKTAKKYLDSTILSPKVYCCSVNSWTSMNLLMISFTNKSIMCKIIRLWKLVLVLRRATLIWLRDIAVDWPRLANPVLLQHHYHVLWWKIYSASEGRIIHMYRIKEIIPLEDEWSSIMRVKWCFLTNMFLMNWIGLFS